MKNKRKRALYKFDIKGKHPRILSASSINKAMKPLGDEDWERTTDVKRISKKNRY